MPGMKSIRGPIQLKGLTIVNSKPFSAPSAANNHTSVRINKIEKEKKKQHLNKNKSKLTINQPLNQLFRTGIRPPLFFNRTKNARRLVFFKNIVCRILTQIANKQHISAQSHQKKETTNNQPTLAPNTKPEKKNSNKECNHNLNPTPNSSKEQNHNTSTSSNKQSKRK